MFILGPDDQAWLPTVKILVLAALLPPVDMIRALASKANPSQNMSCCVFVTVRCETVMVLGSKEAVRVWVPLLPT